MLRNVRLTEQLASQVEEAARSSGLSASQIVRKGVRRECEKILSPTMYDRWSDVIGSVRSKGAPANSRKTGREFTKLLLTKKRGRK